MISSMLVGAWNAIQTQGIPETAVGIRHGGNGKPFGGYQGGGWFYGLYFGGKQVISDALSYEVIYTLGLDITRVWPFVPTAKRGDFAVMHAEFYQKCDQLHQFFLKCDSFITNYCNAALETQYNLTNSPGCCFYEDFCSGSMSADRFESAEWIAAEAEEPENAPSISVVSMTFTGMKYVQPLERTPLA